MPRPAVAVDQQRLDALAVDAVMLIPSPRIKPGVTKLGYFERGGSCCLLRDIAQIGISCYNSRMNATLKITKIGNSAGVVLPKELLAHLGAQVGETLSVVVTPRGIELSSTEADFEAQMAAAREVMARRKQALRELAK